MSEQPADFVKILNVLTKHHVKFIVIGGLAAIYHGHNRVTFDIDICYQREAKNLDNLAAALREMGATLRGADRTLKFKLDARTLKAGLNFTFDTKYGPFDMLGEVGGVGFYEDCDRHSEEGKISGHFVSILSLDDLINAKKHAARAKDIDDLRALDALQDVKKRKRGGE
ncbi:MAG TPA: hypothetical protein VEJ63_12485 [Planctomycetota bacterium]|nr:hypothetical protein [Planctomycetota bacterium]